MAKSLNPLQFGYGLEVKQVFQAMVAGLCLNPLQFGYGLEVVLAVVLFLLALASQSSSVWIRAGMRPPYASRGPGVLSQSSSVWIRAGSCAVVKGLKPVPSLNPLQFGYGLEERRAWGTLQPAKSLNPLQFGYGLEGFASGNGWEMAASLNPLQFGYGLEFASQTSINLTLKSQSSSVWIRAGKFSHFFKNLKQ